MSVKDTLSNEVGGLPLWVWVAAGVAGIGLGVFLRRGTFRSADALGSGTVTYEPYGGYSGGAGAGAGVGGGAAPSNEIRTNFEWRQEAIRVAKAAGYEPVAVERVVGAYLDGTIDAANEAILNLIIGQIGLPPSPPSVGPSPAPEEPDDTQADPSDPLDQIVEQGYRSILGRAPDPGGAAFYRDRLQNGLDVPQFHRLLARSPEARTIVPAEPKFANEL